jgi:hypothetical protein
MINAGNVIPEDAQQLTVLEGVALQGQVNVSDETLLANVALAIRRPYPQIRPQSPNGDRVVLVGGGPSLNDTEAELVDLVRAGAKLVTVNGAYQWCLERNLEPKTQIVMDARPTNARFLSPALPHCRYMLASQCAPETWEAVAGRPHVWMFHAAAGGDGALKDLLDRHYLGQWFGVGGGVTVVSRAIMMLRALGYLRFDLFGVDSCFMGDQHHAYAQAENEVDKAYRFTVTPEGAPDLARDFWCAPWHVKQFEDMLQMIRINGEHFQLHVHGDGLLAYALRTSAIVQPADEQHHHTAGERA